MTSLASSADIPNAKRIIDNPSVEELRDFTREMPTARLTAYDNYNVQTKVVARSSASTFIVTDHPDEYSGNTISRSDAIRLAREQDDYIRSQEMVMVDGAIGNGPPLATPARLIIERRHANIAGMQRTLYFSSLDAGDPELTIIYTPNLAVSGYPDNRAIIVDLDNGVTRVFNSDYFGESKKGGLRMWNKKAYDMGGLALHAGCKIVPTECGEKTMLIVGLSGTGKTTSTFTVQNGSKPVQDDFVAMMPDGSIVSTEEGCFAKTYGLDPKLEPAIHGAVTRRSAYLENVSQKVDGGSVDFFDDGYTQNGRAVFGMSELGAYRDARDIGKVNALLILNRNEGIVPAVARLSGAQAAAYFMLGETQGTSAGGKDEAGKFLRVPGTNPFFPLNHHLQGNRFLELLSNHSFEVFLLNTGRVGGPEVHPGSKKVMIPHSSAVVKAIAEGTISWVHDEDFGYEVADGVPGFDDIELLQPRRLYARQGREAEYVESVNRLKRERADEFAKYPGLNTDIAVSIV